MSASSLFGPLCSVGRLLTPCSSLALPALRMPSTGMVEAAANPTGLSLMPALSGYGPFSACTDAEALPKCFDFPELINLPLRSCGSLTC